MKIFKKTDRTLTLWQSNWPTLWIPLGVVFTGLVITILNGYEVKLSCYRATPLSGRCQLDNNSFFNYQSRSIPFDNIQKVDLEANNSDEEDAATRVLLIGKDGQTMPVTLSGNAEERDQIASQLATFLETPTASALKITDGNLNLGYLMAGATGLTGLAFLLSGGWTIVKFDKDKNECEVSNWGIRGKKIDRCALNHINGVDLEVKNPELSSEKQRLVLMTEQGGNKPLSKKYLSSTQRPQETRVAEQIKSFLGLDIRTLD
jgi:hypothetical protein